MSDLDLAGIDWLGRGWLLLLAFTAAVLLVAALRRPCRRLFGAGQAFQLWLLPPLAMLASQCSHPAASVSALPTVVYALTSASATLPALAMASDALDWRAVLSIIWITGTAFSLLWAAVAQSRYRARLTGAVLLAATTSRWPVLRAASAELGPALVGAWRPRIVLPADFEQRYDAGEQALILAHEMMHARRGDGWWCLLARCVTSVFWCHPLAWWALAAMRHDQELACDAAVLREHRTKRRSYANAMLKTQSASFALPIGCTWSPRHPITERIAMLKQKPPQPLRRHAGSAFSALCAVGMAGVAYAASPISDAQSGATNPDRYSLQVDVAMGGRPESMHFTRCLKPGEAAALSGTDTDKLSWHGSFSVSPVAKGQLEIRAKVDTRFERGGGVVRTMSGEPVVRTMPGQLATIVFGQVVDGKHHEKLQDNTIKIIVTPAAGCAGWTPHEALHPSTISQQGKNRSARRLAEAVAAKAGFVLVNPDALDNRPVTLNFEQMPATATMQLIADIDGKRAVFDDRRVRFETK